MVKAWLAAAAALLIAGSALADTFDGKEAFHHGDFARALALLKPEAARGDGEALLYIGRMYQAGLGVAKDPAKAAGLFRKAAEAGSIEAQVSYGMALALGEGVTQDLVEGLKWMYIAAISGSQDSRRYLKELKIPGNAMITARMAAYEWLKAHRNNAGPDSAAAVPPALPPAEAKADRPPAK